MNESTDLDPCERSLEVLSRRLARAEDRLFVLGQEKAILQESLEMLIEAARDIAGERFLNWRPLLQEFCDKAEAVLVNKKAGK